MGMRAIRVDAMTTQQQRNARPKPPNYGQGGPLSTTPMLRAMDMAVDRAVDWWRQMTEADANPSGLHDEQRKMYEMASSIRAAVRRSSVAAARAVALATGCATTGRWLTAWQSEVVWLLR